MSHKYWDNTRLAIVIGCVIFNIITAIYLSILNPKDITFLFFVMTGIPNTMLQGFIWFEYQSPEQKRLNSIFKDENQ